MSSKIPTLHYGSLSLTASHHAMRCDAKYAAGEYVALEKKIRSEAYFELGDYLPLPFVKGSQPKYLDLPNEESVQVVNTLSIRNLRINLDHCRPISKEDFDALNEERKLKKNDVLLSVDGGVSIGKSAMVTDPEVGTVDSHICILRPEGIGSSDLMYLLACPLAQTQFKRAESGASGQTTVTEDDIRRFIFPKAIMSGLSKLVEEIEKERAGIAMEQQILDKREAAVWQKLGALTS